MKYSWIRASEQKSFIEALAAEGRNESAYWIYRYSDRVRLDADLGPGYDPRWERATLDDFCDIRKLARSPSWSVREGTLSKEQFKAKCWEENIPYDK